MSTHANREVTAPPHGIRERVPLATSAHASTPRCVERAIRPTPALVRCIGSPLGVRRGSPAVSLTSASRANPVIHCGLLIQKRMSAICPRERGQSASGLGAMELFLEAKKAPEEWF
ncbi:hypothetical protein PLICRDRAFT_180513 [Plicaturopsis crispa FD-325 SS-3]|uniref:Uncharacterized protein n=1 Tax=Plicaturopsis crispa FD-325 SS-3 TaxID=944288 RepID=A0A0C9SW21_PLICR|nr:hypothetical protein PLICRDRAFT_180513 [Plicaturopsis crispa FD-325 SS-3]